MPLTHLNLTVVFIVYSFMGPMPLTHLKNVKFQVQLAVGLNHIPLIDIYFSIAKCLNKNAIEI